MSTESTAAAGTGAEHHHKTFGHTYWMLNSIEMFERLAYFGIRAVVPLYIMQATEPGGLHLTAVHKGWIYAWWAVVQSFLPIITGGIADRYGYKRVLVFAISANIVGYIMMANLHDYFGFFAAILVLAAGTAFFKPALQGSIAQNLNKDNASLGWGVFYWVVNIGAFAAPFISTMILGKPHSLAGWQTLFYTCAGFTACNLLLLLTFKDVPSGADKTESTLAVLKRTFINIFEVRLIVWLLIMSCFWLMMYQLWDLHPNFITDWVDSSAIAAHAPSIWQEYGDRGLLQIPQQILLNLNAGLIIALMVPMAWIAGKMRTLSAMLVGMSIATLGVLIAGWTTNGWILLVGIAFFSMGEMWTGPKKNEYLGLIAPPGKKGLYLGYVNIPVGIGVGIGSILGGWLYDNYGEKASLALKEMGTQPALVARSAQAADWSDSLDKLPDLMGIERGQAFALAQEEMGLDAAAAAIELRTKFRYDSGQIINLCYRYLAAESPTDEKRQRPEVAQVVSDRVNRDAPEGMQIGTTAIAEMLWTRFGNEPDVLNDLALEYLAQGTNRLYEAVVGMKFDDPVEEIQERAGISRTKAFEALCAAQGAAPAEVEAAMAKTGAATLGDYLIGLDHQRFLAVARYDWPRDVELLREMIESAPAAKKIVEQEVWDKPWTERLASIFSSDDEQDMYVRLAENQKLIQKALKHKDWSQTPEQSRQLLQLNPFEARALAAAEVNEAPLAVTKMLWEKYHPNHRVWLPIIAIGIAATIALGIFGQMAKRWKDMNA